MYGVEVEDPCSDCRCICALAHSVNCLPTLKISTLNSPTILTSLFLEWEEVSNSISNMLADRITIAEFCFVQRNVKKKGG